MWRRRKIADLGRRLRLCALTADFCGLARICCLWVAHAESPRRRCFAGVAEACGKMFRSHTLSAFLCPVSAAMPPRSSSVEKKIARRKNPRKSATPQANQHPERRPAPLQDPRIPSSAKIHNSRKCDKLQMKRFLFLRQNPQPAIPPQVIPDSYRTG